MLILRDALPIFGVGAAPVAERIDVEVLPVDVDALLCHELVDMIGKPLAALRVAQVQQSAVFSAENPLRDDSP